MDKKKLFEFVQATGQWGLELYSRAVEDGESEEQALKTAEHEYNKHPTPPLDDRDRAWQVVSEMAAPEKPKKEPVVQGKRIKPSPFRRAEKSLDRQGGEEPTIDRNALAQADFITYPDGVEGSNCGNCKFNTDGVCQNEKIKGQPVNNRNCCGLWDAPGTLRDWQ